MRIAEHMNFFAAWQFTFAGAKVTDGPALTRQVRIGAADSPNNHFL
jgi:hypothetical protein